MSSPYNLQSRELLESDTSVRRRPISSHPPKRQCLPESVPNSSSYLDLLPREALENVFRHVSQRPCLLNWKRFIATRDIFALYRCGGSLTVLCKELFTAVSIGAWHRNNDELVVREMNDFLILLDIAGSSVKKLSFHDLSCHVSALHIERILASKCNAAKSLNLNGVHDHILFDKILEKCSGKLDSLSAAVNCQEHVAAMVWHCSGLRALKLLNGAPNLDLSSLWPTVGKSLCWLELNGFYSFEDEDIRCIQTHCRALRHVEISGIETSEALADLFISYGRQLEHALFNKASSEICRRVVNACPNLRCVAKVSHDIPVVAEALGSALKELHIKTTPAICIDGLNDAMKHCANLKKLWICYSPKAVYQIISGIFSSPMAQLEVLNLATVLREDCEKILECIGRKTGGLRDLSLSIALPQPKSFCGIAKSNALLEKVKIRLWRDYDVESGPCVSFVVGILESFSLCPNLRYLSVHGHGDINNSQDVINTCRPFRFKRISVQFSGEYLYI